MYESIPITDERMMTRFWVTISQGVEFVFRAFERMRGGELFVPKIPSARFIDLAQSLAPDLPTEIVGIRPGEKLHEVMCPLDDSHLTVEFEDHYVIRLAIRFFGLDMDYTTNAAGETGEPVPDEFEYNSATNPHFLTVKELRELNARV